MAPKKKLKRAGAVKRELTKSNAIRKAKSELKKIDTGDLVKIESTLKSIRAIFPSIDEILSPAELLGAIDIPVLAACPSCLKCFTCQSCNTCQTCNYCQTCEACNTCQKEVTGGSIYPYPERVKLELTEVVRYLSRYM